MKKYIFAFLATGLLAIIFLSQFKLINQPVRDNDEGIYLTTFRLVDKGMPAYKETFLSQPPGFLLSTYPGFILFGKSLPAARLMVSLWAFIGLLSILWIGYELNNKWLGLMVIGILYLIPYYYHQTLIFQSDLLVSTFSLLGLAALIRFKNNLKMKWLALSAFFINLSFWTKFDIALIPAIIFILYFLRNKKIITNKQIGNYLAVILIIVIVFFVLFIAPFGMDKVVENTITLRVQAAATYKPSLEILFTLIKNDNVLLIIILGSCILGFFIKKLNAGYMMILSWSLSIFILFLFYRPLFPHHISMLTVPVSLLFSYSLLSLLRKYPSYYKKIFIFILVLAAAFNLVYRTQTALKPALDKNQKKAVEIIINNTIAGDLIISDDEILYSLSDRFPPPELADVSFVRIKSKNLSSEKFMQIVNTYKPKLIIAWNGRLKSIKDFKNIVSGYPVQMEFGDSKSIYSLYRLK